MLNPTPGDRAANSTDTSLTDTCSVNPEDFFGQRVINYEPPWPGGGTHVDDFPCTSQAILAAGRDEWSNIVSSSAGDYAYSERTQSWIGTVGISVVVVENYALSRHLYRAYGEPDVDGQAEVVVDYDESGDQIGTHERGLSAQFMEEIFDRCETKLGLDPDDYRLNIHFDDDGLFSSCGYVEVGCADDCYIGNSLNNVMPGIPSESVLQSWLER